jgi:hypothetical protein
MSRTWRNVGAFYEALGEAAIDAGFPGTVINQEAVAGSIPDVTTSRVVEPAGRRAAGSGIADFPDLFDGELEAEFAESKLDRELFEEGTCRR